MSNEYKPPTIRISKAREELLASYADAAGCLYGALSIAEFVEVFNYYEHDKTYEQEATLALQRYEKFNPDETEYIIYNEFILGPELSPDLLEDDVQRLKALRMEQKGKPRYYPERDDFMKFTGLLYIDPIKPYADLKDYILNNKLRDKEDEDDDVDVDDELLDLHEMIQNKVEPVGLLQYFIDAGYSLHDIDQINAFIQVIMTAYNNTRMYENNGFTPNELRELMTSQHPKEIK